MIREESERRSSKNLASFKNYQLSPKGGYQFVANTQKKTLRKSASTQLLRLDVPNRSKKVVKRTVSSTSIMSMSNS